MHYTTQETRKQNKHQPIFAY